MTATATEKATPQQNRERKAQRIARAAWRRGLTVDHLRVMAYSGEDRSLTRFARMAYRESDDVADHDLNPPSSPQSRTWGLVAEYLAGMERFAAAADPTRVPVRDLLAERQAWLPDDAPTSPPPTAPEPAASPAPEGAPDPDCRWYLPRGWAELAALPPLTYRWCIHHPDRRPVVISPDGGRCAACPPRRNEIPVKWDPTPEQLASLFGKKGADGVVVPFESVRDGWGMRLDWAPKHCNAPVRCYCGRCPKGGPPN